MDSLYIAKFCKSYSDYRLFVFYTIMSNVKECLNITNCCFT